MSPHFNGPEYDPAVDQERLSQQHIRIRDLMLDGVWRTLTEISGVTGDPPASISAQLRHLRKKRFGEYVVELRARGDRSHGLFEYRVLPPVAGEHASTNGDVGAQARAIVLNYARAYGRAKQDHTVTLAQEEEVAAKLLDAAVHLYAVEPRR